MANVKIGDKVKVNVSKESREWGYNPCPDGVTGTVIDFKTIFYPRTQSFGYEPGIYHNECYPIVKLDPDLFTEYGTKEFSSSHLELISSPHEKFERKKKLADLPETEFWEDDEVTSPELQKYGKRAFIYSINYDNIGKLCTDGITPASLYNYAEKPGGACDYFIGVPYGQGLKLVQRGKIWRYFNVGPKSISFDSLKEEGDFFLRLSHYNEVRNPKTHIYSYTLEEALEMIREGLADAIQGRGNLFGSGPSISVIKFHDVDLGRRLAAHTLHEFGKEKRGLSVHAT